MVSLRENTYVLLAGTVLAALTLAVASTMYAGRVWVHSGERQVASGDMRSVARAVAEQELALGALGQSIALRQDVVLACRDARAMGAITGSTLPAFDADALIIRDPAGRTLLSLYSGATPARPAGQLTLRALEEVGAHAPAGGGQAVVAIADKGFIVAVRDIAVPSAGSAGFGRVVIARALSAQRLRRIGEASGVTLNLRPLPLRNVPADTARAVEAPGSQGVAVAVQRPLDITAYLGLADFGGKYQIVLASPVKPSNYAVAMRTLGTLVGVMVAGGLALAVGVFLVVDRVSLSRMMRFRDAIAAATDRADPAERITLAEQDVGDEVTAMAQDVNGLLDALEVARRRAQVSEEGHRVLLENMPEAVFNTALDGTITYANMQAERLVGRDQRLVKGRRLDTLFQGESSEVVARAISTASQHDVRQLSVTFEGDDGARRPMELTLSAVRDAVGRALSVTCIARDVSERLALEAHLQYAADHDHLTGLYNRRRFEREVSRFLAEARRHGSTGAMLWCDLDGFKGVNDSLGHAAGDEVLVRFAELLGENSREADFVSRLGGDEFAILLPGASREEARGAAERISVHLQHAGFNPPSHPVTVCTGIAFYPEHGLHVEELLTHADEAMYRAKTAGRGRIRIYHPCDALDDESGAQEDPEAPRLAGQR